MIEKPSNQANLPYKNIGSNSSTNGYVDKLSSHSNLNDVLNSVKCLISVKSILNFEPT